VHLQAEALPALAGALELAAAGVRTGGDSRNRDFASAHVSVGGASDAQVALGFDPQTAGGLLVAVPEERAAALEQAAAARDVFLARIGGIADGEGVVFAA
jgi:selenide,water dikinase